jgi:hypothetical protein
MKLREYTKKEGISYDGAYRRFMKGQIPNAYQTDTGSVFIEEEDLSWKDDLIKLQKEKIEMLESRLKDMEKFNNK